MLLNRKKNRIEKVGKYAREWFWPEKTQNRHTIVQIWVGKTSFIPFSCQQVSVLEIIPWPKFLYIDHALNGNPVFLINDPYEQNTFKRV